MNKLSKKSQEAIHANLSMLQTHDIYVIVSICGYCGELLGVKDGRGSWGISHGICGECKREMVKGE